MSVVCVCVSVCVCVCVFGAVGEGGYIFIYLLWKNIYLDSLPIFSWVICL